MSRHVLACRRVGLLCGIALWSSSWSGSAAAQTPPPAVPEPPGVGANGDGRPSPQASGFPVGLESNPPAVLPPPPSAVLSPAAPVGIVVAHPPANAEIPLGTAPKGPVAPAFAPQIPNIDFGGRLRAGLRFQDPNNPKSFGDVAATLYADLYASGQISKMWKWLIAITSDNYGGEAGQPSTVSMSVLDAMASFEPLPEFRLSLGRMLVMADRYAPSGPWGLDEWFYPGLFVGTPPAVPKSGPAGRDVGITAWGTPLGGHLKYYVGAYQLQDPALSPLVSGRIQVSLLSPEPGWFHRTTYYGDRDLVSIGLGGQTQKHGSVQALPAMMGAMAPVPLVDDYRELNADLIVEKRLGERGALSVEGAYYSFHGAYQPWSWSAVAALAYNSPIIEGIGKLRPSFRFQQAQARQKTAAGDELDPSRIYDAQLTYVVMHWFAHVMLTYRHYDMAFASPSSAAPATAPAHNQGNMIVLGVQLWDP